MRTRAAPPHPIERRRVTGECAFTEERKDASIPEREAAARRGFGLEARRDITAVGVHAIEAALRRTRIDRACTDQDSCRDPSTESSLPQELSGCRLERIQSAVETAVEDPPVCDGSGRVQEEGFVRGSRRETPDAVARVGVEREKLVCERRRVNERALDRKIGRCSRTRLCPPPDGARLSFERIDVCGGSRPPQVASDDYEGARDERIAVELERPAFFTGVVLPDDGAAPPIERAKISVAGADENEVARDRGSREDSATGVESPAAERLVRPPRRPRARHRSRRMRRATDKEHHEQEPGESNPTGTGDSRGDQSHLSQREAASFAANSEVVT